MSHKTKKLSDSGWKELILRMNFNGSHGADYVPNIRLKPWVSHIKKEKDNRGATKFLSFIYGAYIDTDIYRCYPNSNGENKP